MQNPATEASVGIHFLDTKGSTGQGTEELSRNETEEYKESCPCGQTWQYRMGWDSVETQSRDLERILCSGHMLGIRA